MMIFVRQFTGAVLPGSRSLFFTLWWLLESVASCHAARFRGTAALCVSPLQHDWDPRGKSVTLLSCPPWLRGFVASCL